MTDYKILIKEMPGVEGSGVTVWASEIRDAATLEDAVARFMQAFNEFAQEGQLMPGHGMATRTERDEFRVWRHVPGHLYNTGRNRKWTTRSTRADAEQEVIKLRNGGERSQLGIERVHVIEESDGIEWLDS